MRLKNSISNGICIITMYAKKTTLRRVKHPVWAGFDHHLIEKNPLQFLTFSKFINAELCYAMLLLSFGHQNALLAGDQAPSLLPTCSCLLWRREAKFKQQTQQINQRWSDDPMLCQRLENWWKWSDPSTWYVTGMSWFSFEAKVLKIPNPNESASHQQVTRLWEEPPVPKLKQIHQPKNKYILRIIYIKIYNFIPLEISSIKWCRPDIMYFVYLREFWYPYFMDLLNKKNMLKYIYIYYIK